MLHSISRVVLWCGLLALAATAGGCQRRQTWNLAPVEGAVTKGGRPLANVQVIFLADVEAGTQGPRASGRTDEVGYYRLRTDNGGDGAVVGQYRVCIHDAHRLQPGQALPRRPSKEAATLKKAQEEQEWSRFKEKASASPRVPPAYGRPNETPLRVEVQPGRQVIDLEVK
jgi:hypothetical protein